MPPSQCQTDSDCGVGMLCCLEASGVSFCRNSDEKQQTVFDKYLPPEAAKLADRIVDTAVDFDGNLNDQVNINEVKDIASNLCNYLNCAKYIDK
jgi:hypothetical protein